MKILFVTRENKQMPAAKVRCHGFAKYLRKAGMEAEVFSFADDLGAKSGKDECTMGMLEKIKYNFDAVKYLKKDKLIIVLQRCNYHMFAPLFLRLSGSCRLILDMDDWEAREDIKYYFGKIPSSNAEIAMRFVARRSMFCIAASHFFLDYLKNYNDNVLYMPTGVDTEIFTAANSRSNKGPIVLSWMGTVYRKDNIENLDFLIECFKEINREVSNVKLEIAADGIYLDDLKLLVERAGLQNIVLKDWINPGKIPRYLESVDIGLMPLIQQSKFNQAKSPTRLFECMAAGIPVVASDTGEARHIIRNGENGFLAQDSSDFTKKVIDLMRDAKMRSAVGEAARKTVLNDFSLDKITKKLIHKMEMV